MSQQIDEFGEKNNKLVEFFSKLQTFDCCLVNDLRYWQKMQQHERKSARTIDIRFWQKKRNNQQLEETKS